MHRAAGVSYNRIGFEFIFLRNKLSLNKRSLKIDQIVKEKVKRNICLLTWKISTFFLSRY